MNKGILYKDSNALTVMESLPDKEYDLIYLDIPYFSDCDQFSTMYLHCTEKAINIKTYLSNKKKCKASEITLQDIKNEKNRIYNQQIKSYKTFIINIIENATRCLKDDGILCVLAPGFNNIGIDYKIILDQFLEGSANVIIEKKRQVIYNTHYRNNNYILYFYTKNKEYEFKPFMELDTIEKYPCVDELGNYRRVSLFSTIPKSLEYGFEWRGITPKEGQYWRYSKDKLNRLYEEKRIVIDNRKVFQKYYRSEHLVEVSSVWKYRDRFTFHWGMGIDSQSIERMFSMFAHEKSKVLCPFDYNGKFAYMANELGYQWTSICYMTYPEEKSMYSRILKQDYELRILEKTKSDMIYKDNVITGTNDIKELQDRIKEINKSIRSIQETIGLEEEDEATINNIIEKIHSRVVRALEPYSIEGCISEAQEWINPYWDKLELKSKSFILTGILLYNQFSQKTDIDMSPIMIEYCKTLECELFEKIFFGYVNDLINRDIDVIEVFKDAFNKKNSSVFAEFLLKCTTEYRYKSEKWRIEIGKMIFILREVLSNNPKDSLMRDFRMYLEKIFEEDFFKIKFTDKLIEMAKLRNDCAHPSIVNYARVKQWREIIKHKLIGILKYYMIE